MKLATYLLDGDERLGVVDGETMIDLVRAGSDAGVDVAGDIVAFLTAGDLGLGAARAAVAHVRSVGPRLARKEGLTLPSTAVTLLPPVPRPPKIICVARNYAEHAKEAGLAISEIPIVFARFAKTLVGDRAPVVRPAVSE
jgi:acylpyruvate hydrolase